MPENKDNITRVSRDEARLLKGETDYARLDAMTDDDIARAVADDPDAAPLDVDWTQARVSLPPGKDSVTLRLDRDLLDYLRAQGKGYQTLINQILRAWYDAQIKRAKRMPPTKLAAKKHKVKLSAEERRDASSWKKVYAAANKAAAKKAAAKAPKPARKRA
jgi:uncharacterized protein (DUF4415 family)